MVVRLAGYTNTSSVLYLAVDQAVGGMFGGLFV